MKISQLLIFLSIVISVYLLVNLYIFIRGWQALQAAPAVKKWYLVIFLFLSLSYIICRFLERIYPFILTDVLNWIGSLWLAAMLMFFTIILLIDLVRIINWIVPFFPSYIIQNYASVKLYSGITIASVIFLLIIGGHINAITPRVKKIDVTIHKKAGDLKNLNIVLVTDIHLGVIIGPNRATKLVKSINKLNPDIVLLGGDIVDEDISPVIRNNSAEIFKNIKSKYGVFAITGNHEYIGGAETAVNYLTKMNIRFLRDDTIKIQNGFYLVGREDKDMARFAGKKRKKLDELLNGVDHNLPIILLDHQPFKLEDAAKGNVDLQLSGHTHYGQLFPANLITKAVYELSYGYMKKGDTHYYISTGYGSWGPPVRIGTRSEIVNIRLQFE
jgi:uncharacterized protein